MKERPILFSGPMVRAILDGVKTQTRWLAPDFAQAPVEYGNGEWLEVVHPPGHGGDWTRPFKPQPHAVGDTLWVREAWRADRIFDDRPPRDVPEWSPTLMLADETHRGGHLGHPGRYRHARFMPRHFSRLSLRVTDVRVERLGDISAADCAAEGAVHAFKAAAKGSEPAWHPLRCFPWLWCQVHGPDAWERDCERWVWVYAFEVVGG